MNMRQMDFKKFKKEEEAFEDYMQGVRNNIVNIKEDRVNSPSHYTRGSQEAIETIEEAIEAAPSVKAGMLQAQVLKYLLRLWHKDNPCEDAKKAQWYLNRLVNTLN